VLLNWNNELCLLSQNVRELNNLIYGESAGKNNLINICLQLINSFIINFLIFKGQNL
jgi:hypothetical protein